MRGFQAVNSPPERPEAPIAQNSQEERSLEKASKARKELHIVSWRSIKSGLRVRKSEWRKCNLALPPRPLTFRDTIFMDYPGGETEL